MIIGMRSGSNIRPEARAVAAAFTTPPTAARMYLINELVTGAIQSGAWALLDFLHVYAAADTQAALINWKAPGTYNGTLVNAPAFVADRGYTGDGATSYIDTNYQPTGVSRNYQQNSASFGFWSRTAMGLVGNDMGARAGVFVMFAISRNIGDFANGRVNEAVSQNFGTVTDGSGFFAFDRPNSSVMRGYRNGSILSGGDVAQASSGLPGAGNLWVGAANGGTFSTRQFAASFVGASLTATQHAEFYTAMQKYMTGVGA